MSNKDFISRILEQGVAWFVAVFAVHLGVLGQVVGAGEALAAGGAGVRPYAGVRA